MPVIELVKELGFIKRHPDAIASLKQISIKSPNLAIRAFRG